MTRNSCSVPTMYSFPDRAMPRPPWATCTSIAWTSSSVLGICVGQQLLCRHSEEGDVDCIGVFPVEVKRFWPERHEEKVPAMGWNALHDTRSPLFKGIKPQDFVYFVHSYYVPVCEQTIARADYILPYSAAMHQDNFWATQFHPEKSGKVGERLLDNFLSMK